VACADDDEVAEADPCGAWALTVPVAIEVEVAEADPWGAWVLTVPCAVDDEVAEADPWGAREVTVAVASPDEVELPPADPLTDEPGIEPVAVPSDEDSPMASPEKEDALPPVTVPTA